MNKVIVIGLDGLDPRIAEPMLDRGELPTLARLRARGGYGRVETTSPAQTPVAWSTFATGLNPGGHGIFDFLRRDPKTYLPDFSLNRYEQKSPYLPPKAVNLRRGTTIWECLGEAGFPSTVLRCPCTFPPDTLRGRMLSGMGVPDLRGGLGTASFYSTDASATPAESENFVPVTRAADGRITTHLVGPRNPKTRGDFQAAMTIEVNEAGRRAVLRSDGQPKAIDLHEGHWSPWVRVKFKTGLLQSISAIVRFLLVRVAPVVELYASPFNFDPDAPMFAVSHPAAYAKELAASVGTFYTTGMVEDHGGLNNGRFGEDQYLDQCAQVMAERERMLRYELDRFEQGFLFCLFDTPDRLQHMFWRFREPEHPANVCGADSRYASAIEEHYRECDALVGRVLEREDDETLVVVMSDHGFSSFQRGVHLNTWLHDQGLLALKAGVKPGEDAGDFLRNVDWSRTKAYALGIGSLFINVRGREGQGIVGPDEAPALARTIAAALGGLPDPARGTVAVRSVATREDIYSGPCAHESPDLVVNFAPGYRASWATALGGIPEGHLEDNVKKWAGDHIVDPSLVPGVLFMNRPFDAQAAGLRDLAPTILAALGVPKAPQMEGRSLLP